MELLSKKQYDEMASKWKKHGTVYQKWDRYNVRFPTLIKHIDLFKDKNVLEVGCNAGLAGYHIAQVANSYFGVEGEEGYFCQALETQKLMENKDQTEFFFMKLKGFLKRVKKGSIHANVNAVFLSYVLYHFSDKEVRMFEEQILPGVSTIVIMSRYAKRNKKGRRKHNSYAFWHPDNVKKFLEKNGFITMLEWGPDKKFHFFVGLKNVDIESSGAIEEAEGISTDDFNKICSEAESRKISYQEQQDMVVKGIQLKNFDVEEDVNENTGEIAIHSETESETSDGRSTCSGEGRVAEGEPCGISGGEVDTEGSSEDVRSEEPDDGGSGVLQSGMGESTEDSVCEDDFPEVDEIVSDRDSTEAGEDNNS